MYILILYPAGVVRASISVSNEDTIRIRGQTKMLMQRKMSRMKMLPAPKDFPFGRLRFIVTSGTACTRLWSTGSLSHDDFVHL
uniref:Uncharacterized protein n=1 Tax=Anopheles christyi TaxID=43041 RepID=A0A182KIL1_9DIPT